MPAHVLHTVPSLVTEIVNMISDAKQRNQAHDTEEAPGALRRARRRTPSRYTANAEKNANDAERKQRNRNTAPVVLLEQVPNTGCTSPRDTPQPRRLPEPARNEAAVHVVQAPVEVLRVVERRIRRKEQPEQ